ncbi:MAG: hypothetical protein IKO78_01355 [Bacilli bacterium]|nr:hypothetical protein [Bacilli bacterium]MBR6253444.1 hypothetical protein [Clostridia bacterium]
MAIEKDEELFKLQKQVESIEPGSLTTFGNNIKDNLTVFGNRTSAIMDGSSDDGWDDKVKTQIKTSMQTIVDAAKEKEKAADHVMGGEGIISTMKYAVNEYKDTFEQYETRLANVPTKYEDEKDEDGKNVKTQAYKDWEKDIFIFEKAIPELQEQANTWVDQVKAYFSAYDFAKNEVDSNIYKPITDPLVFFGDLKTKYEGDYVEKPLEENEQAEEKAEEKIEETEEAVAAARKKEVDDKTKAAIGELVTEGIDPDSEDFADKLAEKLKDAGLTETEIAAALEAYNKRNGEEQEPTTEEQTEAEEEQEPTTEKETEAAEVEVVSMTTETMYGDDGKPNGTREIKILANGQEVVTEKYTESWLSGTNYDTKFYGEFEKQTIDGREIYNKYTGYTEGENVEMYHYRSDEDTYEYDDDNNLIRETSSETRYDEDGSITARAAEYITYDHGEKIESIDEYETIERIKREVKTYSKDTTHVVETTTNKGTGKVESESTGTYTTDGDTLYYRGTKKDHKEGIIVECNNEWIGNKTMLEEETIYDSNYVTQKWVKKRRIEDTDEFTVDTTTYKDGVPQIVEITRVKE